MKGLGVRVSPRQQLPNTYRAFYSASRLCVLQGTLFDWPQT